METYTNNVAKRQLTLTNSIHEVLATINYDINGVITFSKEWAKGSLIDLQNNYKNILK